MPTQNIFDLVDTWASGGGPYTSIKMNATDNDVGSASLLMDLQVATASKFSVSKAGSATFGGSITATASGSYVNAAGLSLGTGGAGGIFVSGGNAFTVNSSGGFRWSSNANVNVDTNGDLILSRRAAANLRLGAADAASGVQAQTLSVQSITGTNASAAAYPFKITGAQGTGNAAGGSIIFQVAPAGGAGPAQNTLVDALTIDSTKLATFAGNVTVSGGTAIILPSALRLTGFSGSAYLDSGDSLFHFRNYTTFTEAVLAVDATNTLALRNGTAAQAYNTYGTYTDGSNYRRVALAMTTAGVATLKPEGAGTGASGNVLHISGLPTSNPGPGILWNNAGTPAIGT